MNNVEADVALHNMCLKSWKLPVFQEPFINTRLTYLSTMVYFKTVRNTEMCFLCIYTARRNMTRQEIRNERNTKFDTNYLAHFGIFRIKISTWERGTSASWRGKAKEDVGSGGSVTYNIRYTLSFQYCVPNPFTNIRYCAKAVYFQRQ